MEKYFQDMLYLTNCAVHNKKAVLSEKMDFERIIKESYGQSVLLWVLSAIISAENPEICPKTDEYRKLLVMETSKNAVRRNGAQQWIEKLRDAGLNPVVIKGETLSLLYPQPLLRMRVDTDLFFMEEAQCAAAYRLMTGKKERPRGAGEKHYCIDCAGAGRVELHYSLVGEEFEKIGIDEKDLIKDSLKEIKTSNGFILTTLSETDALKYIFCHLLGHFLFARCDLRQIIDINMYISRNKSLISLEKLNVFLKKIGKKTFFDTLQGVGIEYLGFSKDTLFVSEYDKETAKMLMEDCLNGGTTGVWGKESVARGVGLTSIAVKHSGWKAVIHGAARVFLPQKDFLFRQFPYCKGRNFMLPVAWVNNLYAVCRGAVRAKRKLSRRKMLFIQMDLMKKE